MHWIAAICVLLVLCINLKHIAAQTQKPYAFGFTVEKQQHRSEKRDERGIVMGEFGFITADGIYHVTVYATDEEGRFRILAMRNYPYEEKPKTIEMTIKPKQRPTLTTTTIAPQPAKVLPRHNFANQACSGCFLTNNVPKQADEAPAARKAGKVDIRPLSRTLENGKNDDTNKAPKNDKTPPVSTLRNTPLNGNRAQTPTAGLPKAPAKTLTNNANTATTRAPSAGSFDKPSAAINPKFKPVVAVDKPAGTAGSTAGGSTASTGAAKPAVKSGGAAAGVQGSVGDAGDLYRFKYVLDYNGHTETGSRNGNKQGSFFAIGDDNVERTIEYIANEFGFQPKIRWRKLDAPVQAQENTLKDYEFVWFNKP